MKISVESRNSGWVIDHIGNDFRNFTKHEVVNLNNNPDVFWSVNLFSFPKYLRKIPKGCKSIVHIHHIDETKINEYNFKAFNKGSVCIVYNDKVKEVAEKYINIPIFKLPYWILSNNLKTKNEEKCKRLRMELGEEDDILIGSFVKDGNGKKGEIPKLSKGPDIFINVVEKLSKEKKIKVVLAGYARRYIINKLKERNIPYVYKEMYDDIQSLYDCMDWYFVTSRVEGGPQSILESSYRKVKILSTDVGIASDVLHPNCICDNEQDFVDKVIHNVDELNYNYKRVMDNHLPINVIPKWDSFFENSVEAN